MVNPKAALPEEKYHEIDYDFACIRCRSCFLLQRRHFAQNKPIEVRHGGVVVQMGDMEYELVAKPDSLNLFVYDDDKPAATKGGKARVVLTAGNDKKVVELEPAGGNKFKAKGNFTVKPGSKAVATIELSGRNKEEASFTLK